MRDTWLGSGIGTYEKAVKVQCESCDYFFTEDLTVDDYGVINEGVICPKCDEFFEVFLEVRHGQDS
jgi:hypothetical protein